VFMVSLPMPTQLQAHICATETVSQHLAQSFATNSKAKDFQDDMPNYLSEYEDVFSKASFDVLPERWPWDHVIELEEGATPANCKVYPMSLPEQARLNDFIQEHLLHLEPVPWAPDHCFDICHALTTCFPPDCLMITSCTLYDLIVTVPDPR